MLAIGTRFFGKDSAKDLPRLAKFVEAALQIGKVYVAVNAAEDKCDTVAWANAAYPDANVFAVTPWQKFVAPLNAIVYSAAVAGADRLLLASAEFPPDELQVNRLLGYVDDDTLVAGARFSEHIWKGGVVSGNGSNVPWNTFAVWNMKYLAKLGFPLAGDAPFDQKQAGVEEVTAISLYQEVFPGHGLFTGVRAKLVAIPGFYEEWNMDGWDDERRKKHEAKITSKISRPAAQLAWMGLRVPRVEQIV